MPPKRNVWEVKRGNHNVVVFDLSEPNHTRLTLPKGSTWTSGAHWHELHTEQLEVVQGRILLRLNGTELFVSSGTVVIIDKFAVHEWMRADRGAKSDGKEDEEVIVIETTDPDDGDKQIFFRRLVEQHIPQLQIAPWKTWFQILLTSARYDNYEVLVWAFFTRQITHLVYFFVQLAGNLVGMKP